MRINERKAIFAKLISSPKSKIPNTTEPTAPIPVHTGYAMLIGIVLSDVDSNHMLMKSVMKKRTDGMRTVKPFELFK